MNRIDRYIASMFLMYFISGIVIFVTMFLVIDTLGTMVTYKNIEMSHVAQYYAYYLPEIIYKMFPVSCLLGTILTISTLSRDNELVALFASGMSLIRISTPVLILVLLLSIANFFASDVIMPNFAKNKSYIFYNYLKKNPSLYSTVKTNKIWYKSHNSIFNLKTLNDKARSAQGLTLYYFNDDWDLLQMITARDVDLSSESWKLNEGSVTIFTQDTSFPLTQNFKTKVISMGEDAKDLASTANTSEQLRVSELSQFIEKNKEAGLDTVRYEVDLHSKFSYAFTAIIMVLLGIPFSVGKARSGGIMMNVGLCLAVVFIYLVLSSSGIALGQHGHLAPIVAAWLPNAIMFSVAYYLLKRTKK